MQDRVMAVVQPIRDRWEAMERRQKILIFSAIGVVLLALALTVFLATRTTFNILSRNVNNFDASQIVEVLNENGITNRTTQDSQDTMTIEVDQARINDARLLIETMGIAPERNFTYEDALEFSGISATETVTRNNLVRARQTDLENVLMQMSGVHWARVELALPDANRFFIQTADPASAAITLATSRRINSVEAEGIARFISSSVLGLEMENVEIIDTDFNVLFSGRMFGLEDEEDTWLSDLQTLMAQERIEVTGRVRDQFRALFDSIEVAPNLFYLQTLSSEESVRFGIPVGMEDGGILLNELVMNATARGNAVAFAPGLDSNAMMFPSYPTTQGGDMQATQNEADRTFGVDEFRNMTQDRPSTFIRDQSSISVTLARFVQHNEENLRNQAENGFTEADWAAHQVNTRHTPILDPEELAIYENMIMMATGIQNVSVSVWDVPYFINYEPTPTPINQIVMYAILALILGALAFALIQRTRIVEEEDDLEPELSVEDLLVSTQMEEEIDDEILETIGYEESNEAKRKLDEFIEDKPEAAASLLRHWLNEAEI
ncbi:MAG: hypothetical protein FWG65_04105 [Turicibacter sp.]|nr:hypothetical protein [Turicibacter sp.]